MLSRNNLWKSVVIILSFLFAKYAGGFFYLWLGLDIESIYWRTAYVYSYWLIIALLVPIVLFFPKNVFQILGLNKGLLTGFWVGLLCVSPMFISGAVLGQVEKDMDIFTLFRGSFLAGFMEELLYRAFLFGILFRFLKWGFIPAALLGAFIFGIGHLYQSNDPLEAFGIFIITFGGAGWFAWLYIEWNHNLWIPVFLHIFMNFSWGLFNLGDNALGSWMPNLFRIATIALSVWLTIYQSKKRGDFLVNNRNLLLHRTSF